jgi:hypothetical protein
VGTCKNLRFEFWVCQYQNFPSKYGAQLPFLTWTGSFLSWTGLESRAQNYLGQCTVAPSLKQSGLDMQKVLSIMWLPLASSFSNSCIIAGELTEFHPCIEPMTFHSNLQSMGATNCKYHIPNIHLKKTATNSLLLQIERALGPSIENLKAFSALSSITLAAQIKKWWSR